MTAADRRKGIFAMNKTGRTLVLLALAAGLGLTGCAGGGESADTVAVQSVSMLAGLGNVGVQDRFAGEVVAQATQEIEKDAERTVGELLVEAGDTVQVGDVLFTYDTDEIQLSIETAQLELEKLENTIESTANEIAQLEKDKKKASSSDQLAYSIQIQTLEAENKENEYNLMTKKVELEGLEKSLENAEVKSEIDGIVQTINEDGATDDYGNAKPYIVLMETGAYRVKGTVNEMNVSSIYELTGQSVIIRSRVDSDQTWTGIMGDVDTENPESSNSYYYYSDSSSQSSKYPFYVTLEDSEGLMMGQHVYIEMDQGQDAEREGLWLASVYLDLEDGACVWVANDNDKLEKRTVTLGEYDEELDEYQIESGLEAADYIAIPDESLKEGQPVTRYDDSYFAADDGEYSDDDVYSDDGEYSDDGVYSDDSVSTDDENVYSDSDLDGAFYDAEIGADSYDMEEFEAEEASEADPAGVE